ncbi:MAG: MFS transporter [Alphaproteobacteria bacterium]|nr:MFS transporter [Alphaproteobacteria bacterium]
MMVRIAPDNKDDKVDARLPTLGDGSLWAVGWMHFFWSAGTIMVGSLLPTFLTEVLHASHTKVGILEGVAIALMFASKIISGVVSDIFRTRKPMIAIGSLFTILVKFMFAAATSFNLVFMAKCIDRLSKGVRSAPTDALIADLTTNHTHGKSYGIRQTLYPLGVVFGSLLAMSLMMVTSNNYRTVFLLATIPGVIALLILVFLIPQPKIQHEIPKRTLRWNIKDIKFLSHRYWLLLGVTTILMLARFSEAFLNLQAKSVGWQIAMLPLLFVAYELVHSAVAYPIGRLADKVSRQKLLLLGMGVLLIANYVLAGATTWKGSLCGVMIVGLHMGMTQGLISAMIAEEAPADLRGTAFALYYFCIGGSVMIGNVIAGHLSDTYGVQGCFFGGMVFTSIAALALGLIIIFSPSDKK